MHYICDASLFTFIMGSFYWTLYSLAISEDVLAILLLILIFIMFVYFYRKHTQYTEKVPQAMVDRYKDL